MTDEVVYVITVAVVIRVAVEQAPRVWDPTNQQQHLHPDASKSRMERIKHAIEGAERMGREAANRLQHGTSNYDRANTSWQSFIKSTEVNTPSVLFDPEVESTP